MPEVTLQLQCDADPTLPPNNGPGGGDFATRDVQFGFSQIKIWPKSADPAEL